MFRPFFIIIIISLVLTMFFKSDMINSITKNDNLQKEDVVVSHGTILPKKEKNVFSRIPGVVDEIYINVGDFVIEGSPLVKIKPMISPFEIKNLKRELKMSEIALESLKIEYDRSLKLLKKNLIAKKEFENIESEYKSANLRYNMIRDKYDYMALGKVENMEHNIVRAPIKGVVLDLFVRSGDIVQPIDMYQQGTILLSIANMEQLVFKGTIKENNVSKIKINSETNIFVPAIAKTLQGKISQISPKAKIINNETYFDIQIEISSKELSDIKAGFNAKALINPIKNGLFTIKN